MGEFLEKNSIWPFTPSPAIIVEMLKFCSKLANSLLTECSEDLHDLLNTMAESKTKHQCRTRGEIESEWKVASNLTYLRRQLSVCAVRAVADSLLDSPPPRNSSIFGSQTSLLPMQQQ